MQKNKGITLVALVITIIILLILAGVAISMITGGEGLFAQANSAATKYNQAAKNEADFLNQLLNGNYTFGGDEETPKEPVPDLIKESNMDFIYKPDTWTNGTVNVEITTEITGYTLQYSLDEGETWNDYTEEIPVTTNGKIILARLAEGERTGGIATGQVENIDTQKPKAFNLTATAGETSITVSAEGIVEDADEIEGVSGKSGIRGYQFKIGSGAYTEEIGKASEEVIIDETTNTSYTFTGLTAGTRYKVSMIAIDQAENPTEKTIYPVTNNPQNYMATEIRIDNKTINGLSIGSAENPIIPMGFQAINEENANWGNGTTPPPGWNEGLVIQDKDGNQFVWVPIKVTISSAIQTKLNNNTALTVEEIKDTWSRKAWVSDRGTSSKRGTLDTTKYTEPYSLGTGYDGENADYIEMGTSVLKNGGFYVGRYEGGTETARTAETDPTTTLVSKAHVYPYNWIAWGKSMSDTSKPDDCGSKGAVELCREMYTGKNGYSIKSSLIYGVQWDSIMEWIENERNVSNSTEWGNYEERTYTIKAGTEYYDSGNGSKGWQTATYDVEKPNFIYELKGRYKLKTGEFAEKVTGNGVTKNIFDIAGNCHEWTMEAVDRYWRTFRDVFCYDSNHSAAGERSFNNPNNAFDSVGVRVILYV